MGVATQGPARTKASADSEGLITPIVSGLRTAAVNFVTAVDALSPAAAKPAARARMRTADCYDDACHCKCCVVDADLVIYSHLGERRIVTLLFENPRRRERAINLALGNWTTRGGTPAPVRATLSPPAPSFVLAPCSRQHVVLSVETDLSIDQAVPDVDDCTVYYAQLTAEDCTRPVRIAVALLPRDCDAYEIRCSCCC